MCFRTRPLQVVWVAIFSCNLEFTSLSFPLYKERVLPSTSKEFYEAKLGHICKCSSNRECRLICLQPLSSDFGNLLIASFCQVYLDWTRGKAQWLRACTPLAENLSLVASTYIGLSKLPVTLPLWDLSLS